MCLGASNICMVCIYTYIRVCQYGCLQRMYVFIIQHVCKCLSESVSLIRSLSEYRSIFISWVFFIVHLGILFREAKTSIIKTKEEPGLGIRAFGGAQPGRWAEGSGRAL